MNKLLVNNNEKLRILENHGLIKKNVAIVELLSLDEKYAIFLDELYDIEEKKCLGNVWENLSNFKLFFESSLNSLKDFETPLLKEFEDSLNKLLITEGNSTFLKEEFMSLMNEGWWDSIKSGVSDFTGWAKEKGKEAYQGVKSTVQTVGKGLEQFKNAISKGEWSEVMSILGKGVLFLARKLRSALYHPVGLIFDAILVASGIGKTAQFVVWGVVVALDIYELTTGDYENKDENMMMRLLFTGVDIIGLVFAGVAAKSANSTIAGIFKQFGTSTQGLSKAAKSSPVFKGILEKIQAGAAGASTKMSEVSKYLQKNSPKIYSWFSGIISGLGGILKKITNAVGSILKGAFKVVSAPGKGVSKVLGGGKLGKGSQAALNTTAIVYGAEKALGGQGSGESEAPNIDFSEVKIDFSKGL
jgi:hypothetical protein